MNDYNNPNYMFNSISNELLCKAVKGEIDLVYLAKIALASRGLNQDGNWIGFENAKKLYQ